MSHSALVISPTVTIVDGKPTTLSTDLARHFGKRHDDVLRSIRTLLPQLPDGGVRNFAETSIADEQNGQTYPAYRLTRDGFTLLAMGFTGKKALTFKLAYIDAFNRMEAELLQPAQDPNRIERARQLANAATAQVYQAVFDAVLNSNSSPYNTRLLLGFTGTTAPMAYVQALENGAFAMTLPQLTKAIHTDLMVSNTDLAHLAAACTQRMAERAEVEARRNAKAQGQWQIQ